jgi:DnaJ-class molecular chaperone
LKEQPHPHFIRQNVDLIYKKKITLRDALCGCSFNVKHLSGELLRIHSKGVIKPNDKRVIQQRGIANKGNLIIDFDIEFPEMTDDMRDKLSFLPKSDDVRDGTPITV